MQATKSGRTRERRAKEFQDFCERTVCVSALENWQCEVPELQMSIRLSRGYLRLTGFMFCESSFLGVRKLREG